MKRFSFRFEQVSKVKKQKEQEALRVLTQIQSEKMKATQKREKLSEDLNRGLEQRSDLANHGASSDLFRTWEDFVVGTRIRIRNTDQYLQKISKILARAMQGYLSAKREFETYEKIRERDYSQFREKLKKLEQKNLDDIYIMSRNRRGALDHEDRDEE